jgi:hypothetical protein
VPAVGDFAALLVLDAVSGAQAAMHNTAQMLASTRGFTTPPEARTASRHGTFNVQVRVP